MMNRKSLLMLLLVVVLASVSIMGPIAAQDDAIDIDVWIAFTDHRLEWARQTADLFMAEFPQYNIIIQEYSDYEPLLDAYTLAV